MLKLLQEKREAAVKNILMILCMAACLATQAWADPAWKASITVSEEYSDNTGEDHDGEEDFVTSLRPSLSYTREGSRFQFQSAYTADYRYYARQTEDEELNHDLKAHALLEAWKDFFFLDATDTYSLVNEDRTRGEVREEDSTSDLVQQNVFTFSPYITPRIGDRTTAKLGYAYSNIWYDDDDYDSKNIHRGFVDGDYELSLRAGLLSGYSYTRELWEDETVDRHIAYIGGRYAYAENGDVYLKIGPQYTRYQDSGSSSTGLYWDAGLDHDFGAVQLALSTGVSFDDDPDTGETYERKYGTVRLTKVWPRTTASVFATLEDYEDGADDEDGRDRRYRRDETDEGSVRRTAFGLNISHELSARLTGTLGLSHDFDDSEDDTKRWYASLGLNYSLSEGMKLGAWYRFKDSSSDDLDEDYRVNRIGIQLTYLF